MCINFFCYVTCTLIKIYSGTPKFYSGTKFIVEDTSLIRLPSKIRPPRAMTACWMSKITDQCYTVSEIRPPQNLRPLCPEGWVILILAFHCRCTYNKALACWSSSIFFSVSAIHSLFFSPHCIFSFERKSEYIYMYSFTKDHLYIKKQIHVVTIAVPL